MLQTRVIPCLLMQDGELVKTIRFRDPKYVGDPVNAVRIFNEKEVDELVLLDIAATVKDLPVPFQIIENIASECFMPVAYGGGIKNIEDAKRIFSCGIEKIIINTQIFKDKRFISKLVKIFGSQSIVVSIDVKKNIFGKYNVMSSGGRVNSGEDPIEYALYVEREGAGEILLYSIDKDGTMTGFDLSLLKRVTSAVNIPVIACGGAGTVDDLRSAIQVGGCSAVAAGSMVVYHDKNRSVLINFPARDEISYIQNQDVL